MSITNSNSNFGNTSLHAIGFKGFAFNQDKGGYITDIIPPKQVVDTQTNTKKVAYYTIDIQGTLQESGNYTKLFLGSDDIVQPTDRPAATIERFARCDAGSSKTCTCAQEEERTNEIDAYLNRDSGQHTASADISQIIAECRGATKQGRPSLKQF